MMMMTKRDDDADSDGPSLSRAEFWQRVAGISFGVWSLMIPLGIWMLSSTFDRSNAASRDAAVEFVAFAKRFDGYVLAMERRVTIIEERQNRVLKTLDDMDSRLDGAENKLGLHIQGYGKREVRTP